MKDFKEEAFKNPPGTFRGTPLWCWNNRLDRDQLCRQLPWLKEMGMAGGIIHFRTGLDTEYLGEEFMSCIAASVEKAASLGMQAWLYDEDRWPTGYAGGLITRDPELRERYLLFTPRPYSSKETKPDLPLAWPVMRNEQGRLLARYEVVLNSAGELADYRRLGEEELPSGEGATWHAYLEIQLPCQGWNNQTLGDLLNPKLAKRFLEVTHDRYAGVVGHHFGQTVPGVFTDEPHFHSKQRLKSAWAEHDVVLPFTDNLPESYGRRYDADLLDRLPELFWNLSDGAPSATRHRYHDHLCDRLVNGFLQPISDWCDAHRLKLTGHLVEETTLESQTLMTGDIMRGYRCFPIPGIDILNTGLESDTVDRKDGFSLNTAKQCQSVVRQMGRTEMLSELYGLSGWDFSFADFKAQGDWQAALGATRRVHHLAWVSMEGEAKRDFPCSIFYQQPWWREFSLIEDHFARINTRMTLGLPVAKVGVIHPIESFWLCFGPVEQTLEECREREALFKKLTDWVLFDFIDFDFISESLLPELCSLEEAGQASLPVGAMAYDVIVVPGLRTIRSSTIERLERFADAGGSIVFIGEIPSLVDLLPSDRGKSLAARCAQGPPEKRFLLDELRPFRCVTVEFLSGNPEPQLLHQLRRDGETLQIFVCNTNRREGGHVRLRFPGRLRPTHWDTLSGESASFPAVVEGGETVVEWSYAADGHLLLSLEPGEPAMAEPKEAGLSIVPMRFPESVPVVLSEPNVMPLDLARWKWKEEPWQQLEETLRIEDALRKQLGLPLRRSSNAQPWCDRDPAPILGTLALEFDIQCDVEIQDAKLALEHPEDWKLFLDDRKLENLDEGWWVDEAIRTVSLPSMEPGRHVLRMEVLFHRKTALEWAYLLGNFSVHTEGASLRLGAPIEKLEWGDWTSQGLPFYTGNVTYHLAFENPSQAALTLQTPNFANPLLTVTVNGHFAGSVAFAPFLCHLGVLPPGPTHLGITAFGTRQNAFGCLHCPRPVGSGSNASNWRTGGENWDYARRVTSKGLIEPPALFARAEI